MVYTESNYKPNAKHANKNIIGLTGWSTKWFSFVDLNRNNPSHQLEAGARILRFYLDKYKENYLQALWSYKSRCPKGLRQAKYVLKIASKNK